MNLVETECALIELNVKTHLQVTVPATLEQCVVYSAHREGCGGQWERIVLYS